MLAFNKRAITRATAERLFRDTIASGFMQRPVSPARVKLYAGSILRGEFDPDTGETIKLARYNNHTILLDGQHRLRALIAADEETPGTKLCAWVCEGLDPAVFKHLDQGAPRSVADILTVAQWANPSVCASAGRMLWKEDATGTPFTKPDGMEALGEGDIASYIDTNYRPALEEHVERNKSALQAIQRRGLGGKPWLAYLGLRAESVDMAAWAAVLTYLADPTKAPPHPAFGHAAECVRKVRATFAEEGSGKVLMGRNRDLCDVTVRAYAVAWDMARKARRCTSQKPIMAGIKRMGEDWDALA
jgi:hypothetical protein